MIHHISIPAKDPQHVAQVLAELWQGQAAPFPPHLGSYMVITLDEYGTMIEVYPLGTELMPGNGEDQAEFTENPVPSLFTATHAAISVPVSQGKIEQVAAREGWRAVRCNRESFFDVMEFWVENRLMLELLPPTFSLQYLDFMQPHNLKQLLESIVTSTETVVV